jgi:phosphohistidine phosphatase
VRLYLVHHGDAIAAGVDAQRPLSTRGAADVAALAAEAARRQVHPEAVWHSGKLRARQTAQAFWRACNPLAEFTAVRGLQPGDPPGWMAERLAGEDRDLMCVGHMPNIAALLRQLVSGDDQNAAMTFPSHAIIALERTDRPAPDQWTERWRLDPTTLPRDAATPRA